MAKRNAFYAQSGGVTAVINASAAGVIETARRHKDKIGRVYAGRNGIIGALTEDLIDTNRDARAIAALMHTPAAPSAHADTSSGRGESRVYERLITCSAHDIGYFFYNGGNDSADTCLKVSQISGAWLSAHRRARAEDSRQRSAVTDNCPGFGSVAKYVATSMRSRSTSPRWPRRRRRSSCSK
jgi:6-phosphofructokinase 1